MKTPSRVSPTVDTNSSSLMQARTNNWTEQTVDHSAGSRARRSRKGRTAHHHRQRPEIDCAVASAEQPGVGHGREHHRQRGRGSQAGDPEGEAKSEIADHVDGHGEHEHQHRSARVAERVRGTHHHLAPPERQQCGCVPQHRGRRPLGIGGGKAAMLEQQRDQRDGADDQETRHRHQHGGHRCQASTDQPPHLIEVAAAGSGAERGIERSQQRRDEQGLAERDDPPGVTQRRDGSLADHRADRPIDHRVDIAESAADQQRRNQPGDRSEARILDVERGTQAQPQGTNWHQLTQQPGRGAYDEPDGKGIDTVTRSEHNRRPDHDQVERNSLHRGPEEPAMRLSRGGKQVSARYQHGCDQHDASQRGSELRLWLP